MDAVEYIENDAEERARLGAELLARAADAALRDRGRAVLALSGGSTPLPAYRALAALDLDWARIAVFLVDERVVPLTDARSNGRAIKEAFGAAGGQIDWHFMDTAASPGVAAATYEQELRRTFGVAGAVAFDALTLGIGADGHTASLFPQTGAVHVEDRLVAVVEPGGDLEPRLTLTTPVICEARTVVVMAAGEGKREPVLTVRGTSVLDEDKIPAAIIRRARGDVTWLLDAAAAPRP